MSVPPSHRPPKPVIPFIVLALSLLLSGAAAWYVADSTAAKDRTRFDSSVERTASAIRQRIDTYINMLRGGAGLFATSAEISRAKYANYVARLELEENFPGIQGIGISARITPQAKGDFVARMRARERFEDFRIDPDHERDEYHAIIFLEPLDVRNRRAIGFDMFTEPTRRGAMEMARDTGRPATSGKVKLVQEFDEDVQAGFLIYVPIYYFPRVPETVEARRVALAGFCYAPFRADDLLAGIFASAHLRADIHLEIYDGESTDNPDGLLHRSPVPAGHTPHFTKTETLELPGRNWKVIYRSGPAFEATSWRGAALLVLGVGGILSFVLFALTFAQATAARRAEQAADQLRRSQHALRASESKFRRLADANLVGVAFSTLDGRITDANDEMCTLLGRSKAEVLRGTVRWDEITPAQWRSADEMAIKQLRENGVAAPFEKEFARPDGSTVPVLVGIARLEADEENCVGLAVDLSVRKAAERDLIAAKDVAERARMSAEEASRLKDEFLATISHELRTPLNAIFGWAQLLRSGHGGADELQHGLETIERSARAQAKLIEDLLDTSRIVAGKLRLEVQSVNLGPVIESAVASIRPAAEAKRITLVPLLDPTTPPVSGDPHRLQQIVWNLLANAVKFTPAGGDVRVMLQRSGEQVVITVSDTGIGVPRDFLPHIFERFRQADPSSTRSYGGLGLGLAIVRHLVELHGGTVDADSEGENRGATFRVMLPISPIAAAHARPTPPLDDQRRLHGLRILVVEDDPTSCEFFLRLLMQRGAQVTSASTAAEGLAAFTRDKFDLVMSDLAMPNEDGFSLLIRLREASGGRHVPIIAVTALSRPQDKQNALAAGFDLHIAKPVDVEELVRVVWKLTHEPDARPATLGV